MTWTNFAVILLLAYVAYYGLNLVFDLVIHKPPLKDDTPKNVLVFEEAEEARQIDYREDELPAAQADPATPQPAIASGPVNGTGAVGIQELLSLAKGDLIQYTKAIPY